jgi:uncharacterized membrane protein YeiH
MLATLISLLDLFGMAVFATSGALVASRKQMDIFGFILLGTVTGVGGGTIRDLLIGVQPVFWVSQPAYLWVCIIVSSIVFFTAHIPESRYRVLLWVDAAGLAAYAVVGAEKALVAGTDALVAVTMGVVTAAFGGIVRDVLGGESPIILRKEIYVTAALAASLVFVVAMNIGVPSVTASLLGVAVGFIVRGCALYWGWSLPAYRTRPGRTPEQVASLKGRKTPIVQG